jgi:hypothetical protein
MPAGLDHVSLRRIHDATERRRRRCMVVGDHDGHPYSLPSSTLTARNLLTSFFLRFFTASGVSSSGDAAVPAGRFLALITTIDRRES